MDSPIYRLLARAEQEKNVDFLKEAYSQLDPEIAFANEKTTKDIENFSQSLYVECAEKAINFNEHQIANRCIQIYFSLPMISNQFLARAYLCQFELLAPKSTFETNNLEKAIPFLFKAIDFSIKNKRYNFLVYNSSLIFWKYARSFIKSNFKRHLCVPLKRITQALREMDDADYEWRAFLERTLIEAYLDNKQTAEANSLAGELLKFIENYLPNQYDDFFEFLISKNLMDDEELKTISLTKWELDAIYRIEKLKRPSKKTKKSAKVEDSMSDEHILNELNEIYKTLLPKKKIPQDNKRKSEFMSAESSERKEDALSIHKRQKLLLNLSHLCLLFEDVNLCSRVIGYLKENENLSEEFLFEIEFIECEQEIKKLKHRQEKFNKNTVRIRVDCITKCHETLRNVLRTQNNRLIQLGCMKQWNFSLPLLQSGLRTNVRKPLQFVADCLETIDSMEWLLRCQIHFELAKCEEEIEQLQTAEQHLLKAIHFDDEKIYGEQLEHALKRLRLRAELYFPPERVEDQVAMILEQCVIGGKSKEKVLKLAITDLLESLNAKNSENPKSEINTRSLILRAGDLLAANEFTHVLESETFKANFGKLNEDQVTRLYKKVLNYENCVKKGLDHLQDRINDFLRKYKRNNPNAPSDSPELELSIKFDFKERLKLWFDLSKIARKQQIWDICRVSCRFCLLYDNDQLISRFLKSSNKFNSLFDVELMRNLAEAHFIFGESLVQYIRGEGIELLDKPTPPEVPEHTNIRQVKISDQSESSIGDSKLGVQMRDYENDKEWNEYCNWLNKLCKEAIDHFLKGIQIGVELKESWLVCQGSAYLWNYFHHIIEKKRNNQILPILKEIFDAIKKVGHDTEAELLVTISVALSTGLMQTWLPQDQIRPLQVPVVQDLALNDKRKQITNASVKPIVIPPEGLVEFKKALEVCEYAIDVTNGDDLKDVISLKDRFPLIKNWVLAKQFCQTVIKNYGLGKNNSGIERVQDKFTKCMVGVEILNRNLKVQGQGSFEIKEPPSIKELINLIDTAQSWPDKLIELELWSNLCVLSNKFGQTENLRYCYSKALELVSYFEKKKTENKKVYLKSQFLLSEACIALGEHLAHILNNPNTSPISSNSKNNLDQTQHSAVSHNSTSKDIRVALRRNALNAFSDAASFSANAECYEYVVHAARHYWNLCLPYLSQAQERATLNENLTEILSSWNVVYKFKPSEEQPAAPSPEVPKPEVKKETVELGSKSSKSAKSTKSNDTKKDTKKEETQTEPKVEPSFESESQKMSEDKKELDDAFDDLTLRCVLYACLFQISLDKNLYEDALEQMETALNELPRTKHRLLIYRFKVITKSKLGLDVQMDLQKFREESEKNLAQMYRKVALSSIKHSDTINSYQRAIETLSSDESIWLKFEYILELAQFMYSNEYNLENCTELIEWALEILMFKIRTDKNSRSPSAVTNTGRASKPQSKGRITNKTTHSTLSIMPTIQDDVEIKSIHKKMDKTTEEEFEHLMSSATKENLFETSSLNWGHTLNWSDFHDIKQLDCFIRSNVILAKMVPQGSSEYPNYLLKAYFSLCRLITLAIENAVSAGKEIQKLGQPETNDKKKSQPDVKKPVDSKSKKNKNEAAPNLIPQNQEQWSQFDLNEEITNSWAHDVMKKTGINQHSLSEPYLTFYYLELLGEMLKKHGWSQMLFPVYYLQLFLVNSALVIENKSQIVSLNVYIRIKMINLCVELNLIQSISFQQQALALLILNAKQATPEVAASISNSSSTPSPIVLLKLIQIDALEVCLSRDQIYSFKQRLSQLEDEENAFKTNSLASFSSSKKGPVFSSNSFIMNKNKQKKKPVPTKNIKISGDSSNSSQQNIENLQQFDLEDLKLPGERKKIVTNLQELLYKDVWIILGEYLIENGYFQVARDYLQEALSNSVTFEDRDTLAKVEYLLGKIAIFDCNFIEAKNYASNAQRTAIDESFWCKSVLLLVDSHRFDYNDKEGYEKSVKILQKSIEILKEEESTRSNKLSSLLYIEGVLYRHLAEVTYEGILNGKLNEEELARKNRMKKSSRKNSMHPSIFKRLSNVCTTYQTSFEIFINNGCRRDAAGCLIATSKLLKTFGDDCVNNEAKKDYYLQTLTTLHDALEILNDLLNETLALQPSNELQNVSLPVQRELVEVKLEISKLLTDMLELHLKEVKNSIEKNSNKDNMTKVIETYAGNEHKNLNEIEQEWQNTMALIPDLLSVYLVSCHNMSTKLKNLKCHTLYLIGRTYRIISELKYHLRKTNLNDESNHTSNILAINSSISKWNPIILDLIKNYQPAQYADFESSSKSKSKSNRSNTTMLQGHMPSGATNEMSFNEIPDDGNINILSDRGDYNMNFGDESNLTNIADQDILKNLLISINQSEAQAMECLLQAMNFSFSFEDKDIGRKICYEIIELTGKFDLNLCSQFVSMYQSYSNAIEAENVVLKSSLNPKNSLLTGYYNLLKFYKKNNIRDNCLNSPITKQLLDLTKNKFNASKFLSVNGNHFNYTKDLPSNYTFLVLQHNESKNELFAAILDHSKSSSAAKNSKQQVPNSAGQSKAACIKIKTDPFELNYLLQQWKDWKSNLQSFNLKLEFQLNNDLIKKQNSSNQTVENVNDLIRFYLDPSSAKYDETLQTLSDLENKFEFLINSTEIYLHKVSDFVQNYFVQNQADQMSLKQNASTKPSEKIVILADMDLLELPFECLKIFHDNQSLCSISRDFSLQFFATRFFAPKESSAEPVKDDKKRDKSSKPTNKQTVAAPVNLEPLPEYALTIDPLRVKYLIDCFNEASTGLPAEYIPIASFKKFTQQFSQICSKWTGLTGLDHSPSLGECESLLIDSSCLLFNGTERFLSYFSSNKMASLNLNDCRLILANDLAQTNKSFGRIGKDDVLRNPVELECENSLETNILLSLTGVRCIMSNQWTTTVVDNSDKFHNIMKELVENRVPCGEILRYRISPHLKFMLQQEKEEEKKPVVSEKDKKDTKKSDKKDSKMNSPKKQEAESELEMISEEDAQKREMEKEAKKMEMLRNLSIIRKENLNMVCYGLPDVYLNIY